MITEPHLISELILKSSVRKALDVVGDRWSLLLVLGAFYGFTRFEDWLHHNKMSSSVLSNRLTRLQTSGILKKEQVGKSRVTSYELTESGLDLFPWAIALWSWENHWLYPDAGHPVSIVHSRCGNRNLPRFDCAHCNYPMKWGDINIERGPTFAAVATPKQRSSRRSIVATDAGMGGHNFGRIVDILGDNWSYLVLSAAYYGARRFDDFQRELDIAPNTLSDRLRRLVDHGFLARSLYQDKPARWEYILTVKTTDFALVPLMMGLWADKWLSPTDQPLPISRLHAICGKRVKVNLLCGSCGKPLKHGEIHFHEEQ